jgi:L-seryl-tRNA(Ser) seleniumtransferase
MGKDTSLLRKIPAVQALLEDPAAGILMKTHGRGEVVFALRAVLEDLRVRAREGRPPRMDREDILARAADLLSPPARKVVNATGVLIHTHLGRSPLRAAPMDLLAGYMNLEMSLEDGSRGDRNALAEGMLARLAGSEAALVVNNNASALLLMLSAFARGGEVLISRGELVEIGGSFRIPDILVQSGCILREVGTTNRTTLNDYLDAMSPQARGILKVHPSNFRIQGFTQGVDAASLAAAAHERGVPLWTRGAAWSVPSRASAWRMRSRRLTL